VLRVEKKANARGIGRIGRIGLCEDGVADDGDGEGGAFDDVGDAAFGVAPCEEGADLEAADLELAAGVESLRSTEFLFSKCGLCVNRFTLAGCMGRL
jgi:hypothetical protein